MSKMPLLSRDTDITKFGGENVQKQIISLLIAFFNIRNSNHKHTCVEHIPNINFVFYPVKSGVLPILQECPSCGASPAVHLLRCISCGASPAVHLLRCISCGASPAVHLLRCITYCASPSVLHH